MTAAEQRRVVKVALEGGLLDDFEEVWKEASDDAFRALGLEALRIVEKLLGEPVLGELYRGFDPNTAGRGQYGWALAMNAWAARTVADKAAA
jgi:hypothetical protein